MGDNLEKKVNIQANCTSCDKITEHEYVRKGEHKETTEGPFKMTFEKNLLYEYKCKVCGHPFEFTDQRKSYWDDKRINPK